MRRVMLIAVTLLLAASAYADRWTDFADERCASRNFGFDGRRTAHVAEETIDAPSLRKIEVRNSPVIVTGGNARTYTITVCKAAVDAADLNDIRVTVEDGELITRGPSHDEWLVAYRVSVPSGAKLDVESRNGPLSFKDIDGTLIVRQRNGPLSLRDVRGDVDAETQNGPVSITGGSGNMKISANNGPVSVRLEGASWEGGTLDASTKNGPLSVTVPRSYGSGVLVESHGRGPIACNADACDGQYRTRRRDWDDDEPRRFEFGRGPQTVRLSTVNGPLTIRDGQ